MQTTRRNWTSKKREVANEWTSIFRELWFKEKQQTDETTKENTKQKTELYKTVLMEETHKYFKRLCYESNKFKNYLNNAEEFIITESMKRCYSSLEGKDEKTTLNSLAESLDEIRGQVKNNYEHSKAAKKVYYPAVNLLLQLVYATIGNKRIRSHRDRSDIVNKEIEEMSDENVEIKKQIKLLLELKSNMSSNKYDRKEGRGKEEQNEHKQSQGVSHLDELEYSLAKIKQIQSQLVKQLEGQENK